MEITTTNLLSKLPAQYVPYIECQRTPDIKSQNRSINIMAIYDSVVKAMLYQGASKLEQDGAVLFIAEKFYDEICVKYPFARHGEIEFAFRKYALGELRDSFPPNQFIQFNVGSLYKAFTVFMASKEYIEAKRAWHNLQEEEHLIASKPTGALHIPKEAIISIFNEYKETRELPVYAWVYYQEICKIKGVSTLITDEAKREEIVKKAKFEYENRLKEKKYHKTEPDVFKQLLNSMNATNQSYIGVCGKIALIEYFNDLISNNKELTL